MVADDTIATRASLLGRLKDREDQASWQEFFDTYWQLIYAVAKKAGLNDAEAQDVVQETVISVAEHLGAFRYDPAVCSFKTWMLRMTRWRIADRMRRRRREAEGLGRQVHGRETEGVCGVAWMEDRGDRTGTLEQLPDPAGVDLEKVWDDEWRRHTLARAMESIRHRIAPEQFQIFHLYAVQQMPAGRVAQLTGASLARVYLTKHRVAALLRSEVRRLEAAGPVPDSRGG